jgi:hypothetical protein
MSDPNAKITARRVDTVVALSGAVRPGSRCPAPPKDPVVHKKGRPRS